MKKKFLFTLPLVGAFLLSGCVINLFGKTIYLFEKAPAKEQEHIDGDPTIIPDVDPETPTQHATSISQTPNAPFYLKIGETREISVSLSPSPTLASEKTFTWSKNNDNISYVVDSKNTNKVKVTGLTAGVTELLAQNDFNYSLKKTFTIKVIDFDIENDYLWQYESADRKQFGYDYQTAKLGTVEGDAKLGDLTWHYTRSKTTSLQSSMGAIGFGKGEEPETHIHLETENIRLIEKFTIEAASAKSLAKMTIKVGETYYLNEKVVPADSWDVIGTITSDPVLPTDGKIEIDIYTPEMDKSRIDDPTYQKPGAFYLKSILVNYKEEVISSLQFDETSQHKVNYFRGESFTFDGMKLNKVSNRGVCIPVDIEKEEDAGKLIHTVSGFDSASHEAKEVELKLTVEGYDDPFTLVYNIHVREESWLPKSIKVEGSVEHQNLIEGDEIDYSNLSVIVIYDESTSDYMTLDFAESDILSFSYGEDGDPFVAEKDMENGFVIVVTGHFVPEEGVYTKTVVTNFMVESGVFSITEAIYDRIDFRRSATWNSICEAGLKKDGAPLSYTDKKGRVRLDFDKVSKGNRLSDHKDLPKTLSDFYITILDKNLSIDKLNIEFANVSERDNNYRLFSSILGGSIYSEQLTQAANHKIIFNDFESSVNNVKLAPGLTSTGSTVNANTGIVSILIRYSDQPHVEYDLSYGETKPLKLDYLEGDEFDPTGLIVNLSSEVLEEGPIDVTQYIEWFDGSSFNEAPQKTLLPASKNVVGVFNDKTFEVAINSVTSQSVNATRVTSLDQITADGKYFITCPAAKLVLLGSSKNDTIFTANGSSQQENVSFGDQISLDILLKNDFITITPLENGKFTFNTEKGFFGLTKGGSATCSGTCPNREFEMTINEDGTFSIVITAMAYDSNDNEKGEVTMYLGCNTKDGVIKMYSTDKANLVIYKAE